MTAWFVSRHPGAIEWAKQQRIAVDRRVAHLNIEDTQRGDVIIGTLPVNMAWQVCARGLTYLNLSLDLPQAWRGRELSAAEMTEAGARLEKFVVKKENDNEI